MRDDSEGNIILPRGRVVTSRHVISDLCRWYTLNLGPQDKDLFEWFIVGGAGLWLGCAEECEGACLVVAGPTSGRDPPLPVIPVNAVTYEAGVTRANLNLGLSVPQSLSVESGTCRF